MVMFKFSNVKLASNKDKDVGTLLECTHKLLHQASPFDCMSYLEYGGQDLLYRGFYQRLPDIWDACSPDGKVRHYKSRNRKRKENEDRETAPKDEEDAARNSEDIEEELFNLSEETREQMKTNDTQDLEVKTSSKPLPNDVGKAEKTPPNNEAQPKKRCGQADIQDACTKPPPASLGKEEPDTKSASAPGSTGANETRPIETEYLDVEHSVIDATQHIALTKDKSTDASKTQSIDTLYIDAEDGNADVNVTPHTRTTANTRADD
ncbi:hypothetical protein FB567DRAFT_593112 [Paraphoma chrysanthemicola]|uniref:Uncharacterized protein n=1 Tax=Paraphoma chrysanthemicola TaxID=798071 RepID=A0A8K0R413_9PLEO|nr:hypothetical protein FB567DRAFT_593112 [Paraphoma chrysanthemicola]